MSRPRGSRWGSSTAVRRRSTIGREPGAVDLVELHCAARVVAGEIDGPEISGSDCSGDFRPPRRQSPSADRDGWPTGRRRARGSPPARPPGVPPNQRRARAVGRDDVVDLVVGDDRRTATVSNHPAVVAMVMARAPRPGLAGSAALVSGLLSNGGRTAGSSGSGACSVRHDPDGRWRRGPAGWWRGACPVPRRRCGIARPADERASLPGARSKMPDMKFSDAAFSRRRTR